jgi:hypothetical protein
MLEDFQFGLVTKYIDLGFKLTTWVFLKKPFQAFKKFGKLQGFFLVCCILFFS